MYITTNNNNNLVVLFNIIIIVIKEDIDENATSKLMPFTTRKDNYLLRVTHLIGNQTSKI